MPLYEVKMETTVCVVAETSTEAFEIVAGEMSRSVSIPSWGTVKLIGQSRRIPEGWRGRPPLGVPADDERVCRDHLQRKE